MNTRPPLSETSRTIPRPPRYSLRLRFLFASLLFLIVLYPLFEGLLLLNLLLSGVLLTALYAVSADRRSRLIGLCLGLPYLLTVWIAALGDVPVAVTVLGRGLGVLFLGFTTLILLRHVLQAEQVDSDTLYGAVSVYLLLGVVWALLYGVIETAQPGSFSASAALAGDEAKTWDDLIYYSFVTLTTLGYGDIAPLSPRVRSLAVLEAIAGVFYVAVLVARLVGVHIAQRLTTPAPPPSVEGR
jgi:hypothetical protein